MRMLEIELILNVDSVFDEVAAESRKTLEWKPVGRAAATPYGDIGVVDDQAIVIGSIEAIAQRDAQFFD